MMIGPEQDRKASGKSGKKKGKGKKAKRLAAELEQATPLPSAVDVTASADAAAPDVTADTAAKVEGVAAPVPESATPDAVPAVGPELLAWIDRVQERVDQLLTLVDPAPEASPATPAPASPAAESESASSTPDAPQPDPAESDAPESDAPEPEAVPADAEASSLAEAWARRQRAEAEVAAPDQSAGAPSTPARESAEEALASTLEPADPEPEIAAPADAEPAVADAEPDVEPVAEAEVGPERADAPFDDEPFEPGDARLTAILVARELIARGERPADVRRRLREGYGVVDPDAVLAQVAA